MLGQSEALRERSVGCVALQRHCGRTFDSASSLVAAADGWAAPLSGGNTASPSLSCARAPVGSPLLPLSGAASLLGSLPSVDLQCAPAAEQQPPLAQQQQRQQQWEAQRQLEAQREAQREARCQQVDLLSRLLDPATAAAVFGAGELLGVGGEGAVRRVELAGAAYALKRAQNAPGIAERQQCKQLGSKWVLAALEWECAEDWTYSLYPLAAGSLLDALAGWEQQAQQQAQQQAEAVAPFMPLPLAAATLLMAQMAAAVRAMHSGGLRHGDIKAANFLVDAEDGCLLLGDLGTAGSAREHALLAGGTPGYMAPEQLPLAVPGGMPLGALAAGLCDVARMWAANRAERRGRADSRPIDVWALGVTWAHLVLPVEDAQAAVAARAKGCSRRQQRQHWPPAAEAVPAPLADLLGRMLTPNPRQRATIEEVIGHAFFSGVDWAAVEGRQPEAVPAGLDLAALAAVGRPAICAAMQQLQGAGASAPAAAGPVDEAQQEEEEQPQQRRRGRWVRRVGSLALCAAKLGIQTFGTRLALNVAKRALGK
ncbi:hypothetical protein Rsub_11178 [Raphidocelis subcapitata]|uniref:Protein kinase domain-containing protein n=1 Tax=Raphidocelis subcapitata TaxID=307507 RepID=A0A2V0PIB2_9CHLO|nr:hypothetical protein Rsub_11178 [Raphidocelis subcapitata]|eukprot:GBF98772.1 hypothetical protein Rsub_11178 [Raphidocelis subcapitata]